jgi:oligopeptide/dipeptide ABC transporter ATP-binding protein
VTQRSEVLLDVRNLKVSFFTHFGEVKAVNDISYYVNRGEVIALVGESGCGKSVSQMSVIQLIQSPPGRIMGGEVIFEGKDLLKYGANSKEMRAIRGKEISMVFQEPMTSLNPVFTIGKQLEEVISTHMGISKKEAWEKGVKALAAVDIPDPEERMKNYPFELSGGMRQRVLIAMAIACQSKLIIADEPTTALDVTTQAQIMELLMSIVKERGTSLVIVTHNLGLVSRYSERIYVMYAGRIVESGTTRDILTSPRHPYTVGLLNSVPRLEDDKDKELVPIEGMPPNLIDLPDTCAFMPRCRYAFDKCAGSRAPELRKVGENDHYAACYLDAGEGSIQ